MVKLNPFRFSTKYQDDESDLLYYGFRYLSTATGRWLSRDKINESGGLNLYCFVANNCVVLFDTFGLKEATTACTEGTIIFDPSVHAGGGWKLGSVDFIDGGTPAWPKQFDGFKVKYTASVAVLCFCPSGCKIAHGTRVVKKDFTGTTDWFVGFQVASTPGGPIDIVNPFQEIEKLVGLEIAKLASSNLPKGVMLDPTTISDIAGKISKNLPTSPYDGSWEGGKSPCNK